MRCFTLIAVSLIGCGTPDFPQSCDVLCGPDIWETQSNDQINKTIERSDVNARDEERWKPLIAAAEFGTPENLQALIDAGADVDARNEDGWTPLHVAEKYGTPEKVQTLIDAGA